MKKYLCFLFMLLLCNASCADFDDLQEALQSASDNMTAENYADARSDLAEALTLAKTAEEKSLVYFSLGHVELAEERYPEARAKFVAVSIDKSLPAFIRYQSQIAIGDSYAAEKKTEQAILAYTKILEDKEADPNSQYSARVGIGDAYVIAADYEKARKAYSMLSLFKGKVFIAEVASPLFVARTYLLEKKYAESRIEYAKVLAVQGKDLPPAFRSVFQSYKEQAQLNIGQGYLLEKNYERAKEEFERVLQMSNVSAEGKAEAERQLKDIVRIEATQKPVPTQENR